MKKCGRCQEEKELSEFYKSSSAKDGYYGYCKVCCESYRKANKEHFNELSRNYARKKSTSWENIIKNRFSSISQRCIDSEYSKSEKVSGNHQQASYLAKGILLEMTRQEFYAWMETHKEQFYEISKTDKCVVSRIDPKKNYSVDNLELISRLESYEKRFGKECKHMSKETLEQKSIQNKKRYRGED